MVVEGGEGGQPLRLSALFALIKPDSAANAEDLRACCEKTGREKTI
jgi:hypothetical protein